MQTIFEDEDEGSNGRGTSVLGLVTCAGRVSGRLERERTRGIGVRGEGIRNSRGILDDFKEGIWRRGRRISKGGGTEEAGAGGEDNGRICAGVQKSSKGKWVRVTATGGRI